MSERILIRGGHVLSMDPDIGDLATGDVLIENGKLTAVQPAIEADAEVIDASGRIVTPGFTINGAHVAGLEDTTGSLTPGKQVDVVLIDARDINVAPVIDPVAAVVLSADVSNVETVIVDGVVRKREGELVADAAAARAKVEAARDHLVDATERAKAEGTA